MRLYGVIKSSRNLWN